ncbi:hypothetical protein EYF80_049361 [Liparis tanakae]|uniref:Uncharacterized protein n=1 Tax=Liparis tanakae TaxID=230148 RepID=A0A4Z2FHR3_9TELE|nr:hypothetical protein EYF80_049361 [Liparis tanakae]
MLEFFAPDWLSRQTLTWLIRSKAPRLGKMAEFLESTDTDALRARQPSSRHTPSHFSVWLVLPRGNCRRTGKKKKEEERKKKSRISCLDSCSGSGGSTRSSGWTPKSRPCIGRGSRL